MERNDVCEWAARCRHLDVLTCGWAARCGHLDVLQWLRSQPLQDVQIASSSRRHTNTTVPHGNRESETPEELLNIPILCSFNYSQKQQRNLPFCCCCCCCCYCLENAANELKSETMQRKSQRPRNWNKVGTTNTISLENHNFFGTRSPFLLLSLTTRSMK